MQIYRVSVEGSDLVHFSKTRSMAHQVAKQNASADPIIDLLDIPTDATAVVAYLNGGKPREAKILRSWDLTPRGGLRDITEPAASMVTPALL